ncbi:hypothetical protein TH0464_11750 [Helicobacter pylori]
MFFEKWDYSLFAPQNAWKIQGIKNNILCYNETFKGCAPNAKQNRQSKQKRGLLPMENKNTQENNTSSSLERNELHNTIWKVANGLRGSVDGWDFK